MMRPLKKIYFYKSLLLIMSILALLMLSCENRRYLKPSCTLPSGVDLEEALDHSRKDLGHLECETMFDSYFTRLIEVAKRDPDMENKRRFSEFLVWCADQGIVSKRQATNLYNRYFNVKFIALMGDYNNCSHTCPIRHTVIANMGKELADKERGLLKISADSAAYYQADHLLKETELVLEATCTACIARR